MAGNKGRTPLHLAAEYNNPEIMRLLLQSGALIEAIDDSDWSPLHLCTESSVAEILVEHGADINHRDDSGLTPLHHAILYEDLELFTTLRSYGASTQIRTRVDGRDVTDMIEDMADLQLRDAFTAAVNVVGRLRSKALIQKNK
ncbi:hypothetical protein OPT61_g2587 [Boeremia exigua]|uniref:Uncharacterized protein n=1 Tax=Boeremia exigua TaxID=749465 RepID=A0ACC2IL71_9PLEO|nr:hypothetical protein OPT61_g2587 [Boeremia exigua]